MATSKEKGDALEYAVEQIEAVMHKAVPGLRDANATIERNRREVKNGVTYENDIWVCVNPDTLYQTFHTIECKNWNKPVGTDEVFKLAGKMEKLALASGTIVAREFTRDAAALAAQSRCLFLHHFADNFWSPLDYLQCAATSSKAEAGQITVHFRDATRPNSGVLSYASTTCWFRNRRVNFEDFVSDLIGRHLHTLVSGDRRFTFDGIHTGKTAFTCPFRPGELFVDGYEVDNVSVTMTYSVEVKSAKIAVKFDVEHRGGFIRMEYPPGTFGHENVALEIVTKPSLNFRKP